MLTEEEKQRLHEAAREAARRSYSPYSHFNVGAAVLAEDGSMYLGTNVENASFGLTICAERVAICNAISDGHIDIIAIAVFAEKGDVTPCGACRQFMAEFGEAIEVIFQRAGRLMSRSVATLLPEAFDQENLERC